jgi:hypothetical protein
MDDFARDPDFVNMFPVDFEVIDEVLPWPCLKPGDPCLAVEPAP